MKTFKLMVVSSVVAGTLLIPVSGAFASSDSVNARLDAISKQIEHVSGADPKILEEVSQIIKDNPKNAKAHFLAGQLYERAGYSELSQAEFTKADELDPSTPQAVLELFCLKLESDDLKGAWDRLGYLTTRFPNDSGVLLMKAMILEGANRKAESDKLLEQALVAKQQRLGVKTAVAQIRLRQGRAKEAWDLVQQDLAKDPNYFRSNVVAGEALMKLNQPDKAVKYLERAYAMNPQDRAYINVYASNLYHAGFYEKALEPALVFLSEQTDTKKMRLAKLQVVALVRKLNDKQVTDGIAAADAKIANTPWQGRLQLALGDIFDALNRRQLAEKCYQRGIELLPDMGRPYFRLAQDYEKDGKNKEAYLLYYKAYQMEPNDPEVKVAFARFYNRMENRKNDIAWRLKDWMHQPK